MNYIIHKYTTICLSLDECMCSNTFVGVCRYDLSRRGLVRLKLFYVKFYDEKKKKKNGCNKRNEGEALKRRKEYIYFKVKYYLKLLPRI